MADKSLLLISSVTAGTTDSSEFPSAIPDGKKWVIKKFKVGAPKLSDDKSSVVRLYFGTTLLDFAIVNGNTYESNDPIEIAGDGIKKLELERQNLSSDNKPIAVWIRAYERN